MTEKPANWPLQSFDARDWAKEFCDIYERNNGTRPDEGWMIGWFANALMRGYDEHRWKMEPRLRELAMLALCANNTTPTMRQGLVAIAEIVGCLVHGRFADAEERLRSMLHGDSPSPSPEK